MFTHLGRPAVHQDVLGVAVAQADEVAGHGVDSCRACVRQAPLEPGARLSEVLQEEIVHARREPGADLHTQAIR